MLVKRFLVRVCGSSAAPKKEAFDPGGLVWPPRSNALRTTERRGKKHLVEVAPLGRLDRMRRMSVQGARGARGSFAPTAKTQWWGAAPPSQNRENY